jgi:hypothetical protein
LIPILEHTYYHTNCRHVFTVMEKCDHVRQSSESCLYACFGSGSCSGTTREGHYNQRPCRECESIRRKRAQEENERKETRARATHAANNYGWGGKTARSRDSYVEPSLGQALVGMPGSEYDAVYDPRRGGQPRHYQQGRRTNWPTPRPQPQRPNQTAGPARPVRSLPRLQVREGNVPAYRPQVVYQSIPEPMRAEPVRMQSTRPPRPEMGYAQRPKAVNHYVAYPTTTPVRRGSDVISDLGSEDGDPIGWRNHAVSPISASDSASHPTFGYGYGG